MGTPGTFSGGQSGADLRDNLAVALSGFRDTLWDALWDALLLDSVGDYKKSIELGREEARNGQGEWLS